jgi:O-antigen/teichoic acid export membrane protein
VSQVHRSELLFVGVPKLLNGATTLGISLYAVRWLDPSAYGALSFCTNCLVLFDGLFGSALDLGVAKWVTGGDAPVTPRITSFEKASAYLKLFTAAILLLVALIAGESLGFRIFRQPSGRLMFSVLAIAGAGLLSLRSLQVYFQMRLRFSWFGATDFCYSTLRIAMVATLVVTARIGVVPILLSYAAAPIIVVLAFTVAQRRHMSWRSVNVQRLDYTNVARASGPALATFGASSLVARMDLFFLAFRAEPAQLGVYGAALTIATIPEILGAYLAPVFLPRILPACRARTFFPLFVRFHAVAYACCGLALGGGLLLTGPVLSHILPAKYEPSVGLVNILLPGTLAVGSLFPITLNFLMMKRPRTFLTIDLISAPLLAIGYLLVPAGSAALVAAFITSGFRLMKSAIAQTIAYRIARAENNAPFASAATVSATTS